VIDEYLYLVASYLFFEATFEEGLNVLQRVSPVQAGIEKIFLLAEGEPISREVICYYVAVTAVPLHSGGDLQLRTKTGQTLRHAQTLPPVDDIRLHIYAGADH
jgi:hypothetical protein